MEKQEFKAIMSRVRRVELKKGDLLILDRGELTDKFSLYLNSPKDTELLLSICKTKKIREDKVNYALRGLLDKLDEVAKLKDKPLNTDEAFSIYIENVADVLNDIDKKVAFAKYLMGGREVLGFNVIGDGVKIHYKSDYSAKLEEFKREGLSLVVKTAVLTLKAKEVLTEKELKTLQDYVRETSTNLPKDEVLAELKTQGLTL